MSKASNKLDRRENDLKAQLETARENGDQKAVERISVFYQMYLKKESKQKGTSRNPKRRPERIIKNKEMALMNPKIRPERIIL